MPSQTAERHAAWVGTPVELAVGNALEDAPRQTHLPVELGQQRVHQGHPHILISDRLSAISDQHKPTVTQPGIHLIM